jgi:hypothetical protein
MTWTSGRGWSEVPGGLLSLIDWIGASCNRCATVRGTPNLVPQLSSRDRGIVQRSDTLSGNGSPFVQPRSAQGILNSQKER